MRNWFIALGLIVFSATTLAQESTEKEAINKDVWYNFMQAYQDLDLGLFLQIHSAQPLLIDSAQIKAASIDDCLQSFNRWIREDLKQQIEFRFLEREQEGDWAYESAIFKLTRYRENQPYFYYGKIAVTLKKTKDMWRIHMDDGLDELAMISEEEYRRSVAID